MVDQQLGLFDAAQRKTSSPAFGRADLSEDQVFVYEKISDWVRTGHQQRLLTMGGLAGSGKTTLLGIFAAEHSNKLIAFATFTRRAASGLQRKLTAAGVNTTSRQARPEGYKGRDEKCLFLQPGAGEMRLAYCGTIHKLLYPPL